MKTLRSKLMLTMLAVAVVVTVVLSIVSIQSINESTMGALSSAVEPLAVQASNSFNSTVSQYATNFSDYVNMASNDNITYDELLHTIRSNFSADLDEKIYLSSFSEDGQLELADDKKISSIISNNTVKTVADKPYITSLEQYKNKVFFSILQKGKLNGKSFVAAVTINADVLNDIIKTNSFGTNGYGYLIDSDGNIILHQDYEQVKNGFNAIEKANDDNAFDELAEATKSAISDENGSYAYKYKGQKYILGYSANEYFDSTLILIINSKDFDSATASAMEKILIIGVIIVALIVLLSILYANHLSKPIVSATKRIRLLAQGNLSDPVDVWYSKDELGVLTNSLEETIVCLRQYITQITISLKQISEGNLCHRMEGTFKGDFQQINSTFNEILDGLSDTFASINSAAEQVTSGAVQVSNSAQSVSQGSTQQASAIEELSVTLNDVSKQVQQNSDDARNAYKIVTDNTSAIGRCNDDMENMLSAINAIHTSSDEISKIIKVIDEIAFQTNILALNAAVEAAREGSKGFGVVADEVRRLASRSAEAAKQTAALIENASAAVSKGTEIAEKTADSLQIIVDGSNEIQSLVKNITDATEAQTEAIGQINTGLDQISAVVSANTSSSVGTASASEELSSQSLILKNMIARFKLNDSNAAARKKGKFRYYYNDSMEEEEDEDIPQEDTFSDSASEFNAESDEDKY